MSLQKRLPFALGEAVLGFVTSAGAAAYYAQGNVALAVPLFAASLVPWILAVRIATDEPATPPSERY